MEYIVKNYNKLFLDNLPIKTIDYINEHIIKIHDELYNNALAKYESERNKEDIANGKSEFKLENYKIIELKNDNYLLPSKIWLISKQDFDKTTIDLSPYWNTNYNEYVNTNIFNELLISDENKTNIEIENVNYVKGTITFKNKFTNKTFDVNIDKIDFNPIYKNKLENTFSYMLKNI